MKKLFNFRLLVLIGVLITSLTTPMWALNSTFTNGEVLFIYTDNGDAAWSSSAIVKMWFNNSGNNIDGGVPVITGNWLSDYDGNHKLFYVIVPVSGANSVQLQRFNPSNGEWWNACGDAAQSSRGSDDYNTFYNTGAGSSTFGWKNETYSMYLYGNSNSWGSSLGTFSHTGSGVYSCTYRFKATGTSHQFRMQDSKSKYHGSNVTVSSLTSGKTYDFTGTITLSSGIGSLSMSKSVVSFPVTFGRGGTYGTSTVTAKIGESSLTSGSSYESGQTVVFTASPASGYEIEGWYSNSTCTTPIDNGTATTYTVSSLDAATTVYVKFRLKTYVVSYSVSPSGAASAITTSPSFSSGDHVTNGTEVTFTHAAANSGYTWYRWENGSGSDLGNGSTYVTTISAATTVVAKYTENDYTVKVTAGTGGTVASASVTGHKDTKVPLPTATPYPGYRFTGWTVTSGSASFQNSTDAEGAKVYGLTAAATVQANFTRTYAYVVGRFHITNSSRNGTWTNSFGNNEDWSTSNANIQFGYDDTNHRFELHTYAKPSELTSQISSQDPYFHIATSTSNSSITGGSSYAPASNNVDVTTAGTGSKKAVSTSGAYNLKFNSSDESGYVVLYFDQSNVWYELEQTLAYNANGGTGSKTTTWHMKGSTATAPAANTFSRTGYTFSGWNTAENGSGASYAAGASVTMNSNITLYAQWTINTYKVKYSAPTNGNYTIKVGSGTASSATKTANYDETITIAATANTGYHFSSWTIAKDHGGTVTPSSSSTSPATFTVPDDSVTVTAAFAPNVYSITYKDQGDVEFSGSQTDPPSSHTYGTATTLKIPTKTGYTFGGWFTASDCGSGAVGTSSAASLGATAFTDNITLYAKWTANTYTVTFDPGDGECDTEDKSVTYDAAYGELPEATPDGDDSFIGWFTTDDDDPVEGTRVTEETIVSTASNHTLYARYETTYEVIVQFKCGSDVLYPQTKVNASASSLSPTITAPEIFGYSFSGWTESGGTSYVDFENDGEVATTITATGSATIVANYTVVPTVYFKNNLGWDSVFVSFDIDFVSAGGATVPKNNGKPYYLMTQIGSTDIYYCEIPDIYTTSEYAGWKGNIAFDNKGFGDFKSTNLGNSNSFYQGEFLGRGDFDPNATMFIPYNGDTETRNSGTYYPTGCWLQYNTNYSGYKVRVNTYVQGDGGTETVAELRTSIAGSTEFTATADLNSANYTYGVMLYKDYQKNDHDIWYTNVNDVANTITSATTSLPWAFYIGGASWQRCRVKTESLGKYKFTVSFATGKPMVNIEYPVSTDDWKLIYKDEATWSNGAHDEDWNHPSRVIKAKAGALDTISFFVSKATGANAAVKLYKCTAIDGGTGAETWTYQRDVSLTGISETGYYNFKVSQDEEKDATVSLLGAYSGNFYIRTDASDGGWSNYKSSKNEMTYSEYADTKKDFTHYFMRYVTNGSNIKFCIANDYNECISDTLEGDSYSGQYMAADGNVRFMWEKSTNTISRAYISGSSIVSDRFLVLEGDAKMFDENGNALTTAGGGKITGLNDYEMKFTDDQNWVYEATIKAQPTARVKLTAKFNNKIQYFYGAEGERSSSTTHEIIGGSDEDETAYKLRIVYDFKIDRLVSAFLPEDAINSALAINADMMIIRDHQEGANQVTFGAKGSLSEVHTVYGAMKFNKYTVNNKLRTGTHGNAGLSSYERGLYWISFPFDVKLGDVFGFGTYYTHWAIEYYDGQERASQGYWADSDGFWKLVPKSQLNTFTLKAFEGYVLALDLDAMTESSSVWNNGVENVYLYFPSDGDVENISATELTVPITQTGYKCNIDRRTDKTTPDTNKDRTIMDSYWHIIGTPSFANYSTTLYDVKGGTAIDWRSTSMPYLYVWNKSTNAYTISSSANHSFLAMHSYMVQYSGTSIYWSSVNVTPASVAARVQDMPDTEYKLSLVKDSIEEDHTYVRMTDDVNVTTAFEFNFDVTKVTNSGQGNIWTVTSDVVPVAGNSQPHPLTTTIVPVGVKIAANGEYTFSMPEGTNGGDVWLIDNANSSRTNLGLMDYTVNLTTGTYEGRFSLEFPVQNVVTDIDNDGMMRSDELNDENDVRKVFVGGRLYILRDGKAYDATGAQVR